MCASTELELARWLEARERTARPLPSLQCGLAVVARRQLKHLMWSDFRKAVSLPVRAIFR